MKRPPKINPPVGGHTTSLDNSHPLWTEDELKGPGGLAESPVGPDLNERDIDLMRNGRATRADHTQQL